MKAFLFTLCFITFLAFACSAQTQKGSMLLGGHGGMSFTDGFSISLSPNLGYFIAEDFALGSAVPLFYNKRSPYRAIAGGLAPFVRYYFGKPAATRVFVEANASYYAVNNKGAFPEDLERTHTYTQNSFGGSLGLVHFISNQVGLEAQFRYSNSQSQIYSSKRTGGSALVFGIQIYLPNITKE